MPIMALFHIYDLPEILGLQPRNKAAMSGSKQKNFSLKIYMNIEIHLHCHNSSLWQTTTIATHCRALDKLWGNILLPSTAENKRAKTTKDTK